MRSSQGFYSKEYSIPPVTYQFMCQSLIYLISGAVKSDIH